MSYGRDNHELGTMYTACPRRILLYNNVVIISGVVAGNSIILLYPGVKLYTGSIPD